MLDNPNLKTTRQLEVVLTHVREISRQLSHLTDLQAHVLTTTTSYVVDLHWSGELRLTLVFVRLQSLETYYMFDKSGGRQGKLDAVELFEFLEDKGWKRSTL